MTNHSDSNINYWQKLCYCSNDAVNLSLPLVVEDIMMISYQPVVVVVPSQWYDISCGVVAPFLISSNKVTN